MAAPFRAAFDGGSRGNPGPAAWGVALLDADGECVEGLHGLLPGHATNNVAEYHGLIAALELARDRGAREVEIHADSELIVRQIEGRYRCKSADLKPLHAQALRLIGGFTRFKITHVPRKQNGHADRLVNAALDDAESAPPDRARSR